MKRWQMIKRRTVERPPHCRSDNEREFRKSNTASAPVYTRSCPGEVQKEGAVLTSLAEFPHPSLRGYHQVHQIASPLRRRVVRNRYACRHGRHGQYGCSNRRPKVVMLEWPLFEDDSWMGECSLSTVLERRRCSLTLPDESGPDRIPHLQLVCGRCGSQDAQSAC